MRALGRVGQPLSGGTYRPRRRLRAPRRLVVPLAVALLAVLWVGVNASRQVGSSAAEVVAAQQVPARRDSADRASRSGGDAAAVTFAEVDGLALALPHPQPLGIGFHEASRAEALAFAPVGKAVANDNATRFTAPEDAEGPEYRVLSSQGRARPATSAVDIVVPLGEGVSAPVSGTVTKVIEYPLYGKVQDWRVEITPAGRPDLTVVLVHLLRPAVRVGDGVTAGETHVAVARLLPLDSHVDYTLDAKQPHTHIEVKPAVDDAPIDPNQPAVPAGDDASD